MYGLMTKLVLKLSSVIVCLNVDMLVYNMNYEYLLLKCVNNV